MASDLPVAVRIHQYLRTLSTHLRERAASMLLSEARDEIERLRLTAEERQAIAKDQEHLYRHPQATVRLPREPEDFEISEANGYAAAIEDFKRALTEAGIEWVE